MSSLQLVLRHFPSEPSTSRNDRLLEAGFLGGIAASNCSVGVVHAFAHSVAHLGIPHSVGNALGLVAGIRMNAETPAMQTLVDRLGMSRVEELIAQIASITSEAVGEYTSVPGVAQLRSTVVRRDVVQRMLGDVCLRSNPQPLAEDAVEKYLTFVDETLQSA